ncbi:hypothetical protein NQ314_015606 [Rhamnusium bicolor]|uniref:Secreted protein n=1 Tax=Rhamnusium bicolor TaxID=1586634 RepID=A0AAV8WYC7_9CUCU|nr:hypothetical protein NQ314_015606 [Rhamnusium bicolor]
MNLILLIFYIVVHLLISRNLVTVAIIKLINLLKYFTVCVLFLFHLERNPAEIYAMQFLFHAKNDQFGCKMYYFPKPE